MNTNLNMQTMPIDRLKPAKYNPRKDLKPGDPAYEKIKRRMRRSSAACTTSGTLIPWTHGHPALGQYLQEGLLDS